MDTNLVAILIQVTFLIVLFCFYILNDKKTKRNRIEEFDELKQDFLNLLANLSDASNKHDKNFQEIKETLNNIQKQLNLELIHTTESIISHKLNLDEIRNDICKAQDQIQLKIDLENAQLMVEMTSGLKNILNEIRAPLDFDK